MKKLSVLLVSILLAMLSLCLFSGCNSNSVEGKYVFESYKIYQQELLDTDDLPVEKKGKLLEEYQIGDVKDGIKLTEEYRIVDFYKDGLCDVFSNDYLESWHFTCCHWEEVRAENNPDGIKDWVYIYTNDFADIHWMKCNKDQNNFIRAYIDRGDLVLRYSDQTTSLIEEFRLKKVEQDDTEKTMYNMAGVYALSSVMVLSDGKTVTGRNNFWVPDSMAMRLYGHGRAYIFLKEPFSEMPLSIPTWFIKDNKIIINVEDLDGYGGLKEITCTIDGDKLVYQSKDQGEGDFIITSFIVQKKDLHK